MNDHGLLDSSSSQSATLQQHTETETDDTFCHLHMGFSYCDISPVIIFETKETTVFNQHHNTKKRLLHPTRAIPTKETFLKHPVEFSSLML